LLRGDQALHGGDPGRPARGVGVDLVATDPSLLPTPTLAAKIKGLKNVQHIYEITGDHDVAVLVTADRMEGVNATLDEIRT